MSEPQDNLDLIPEKRGTRTKIAAWFGGELKHSHVFDLDSSTQRKRFTGELVEKVPALQGREEEIEKDLLDLAVQMAGEAKPDHAAGDLQELDISTIVRPEQFFTPEVSGLAVPVAVDGGGQPLARWWLYLRWADGRRERRELTNCLDLPGGAKVWVHPTPGDPALAAAPDWSAAARQQWLQSVAGPDPADLFQRLCERFAHFLDFSPEVAPGATATLALWTLLTYCYQAWYAVPYLFVGGPLGSGKSRVFEVLARLVFRPLSTSNITGPGLFRTLHDQGGTVLFDEAERLRQPTPDQLEILSMLLAGYKRGGQATRLEKVGDSFQSVRFQVFGPKALACITGLPPALASRCIPVTMFRAGPGSPKPKRRIDQDLPEWQRLRDDLHSLALEHGETWLALSRKAEVCPAGLQGRDYELWQPILSLAWWVESHGANGLLDVVREHALALTDSARDDLTPEADETLLEILAEHIRDGQFPTPGEILGRAQDRDNATFKSWGPRAVSNRLKTYGFKTKPRQGRREYRDVTLHQLRRIQTHYGIDLGLAGPEKNSAATPRVS